MSRPNLWKLKFGSGKKESESESKTKSKTKSNQPTISNFFLPKESSSSSKKAPSKDIDDAVSLPFGQKRSPPQDSLPPDYQSTKKQKTVTVSCSGLKHNSGHGCEAPAFDDCTRSPSCSSFAKVSGDTLKRLQSFTSTFEEGHSPDVAISGADASALKKVSCSARTLSKEESTGTEEIEIDSEDDFQADLQVSLKPKSALSHFARPKPRQQDLQAEESPKVKSASGLRPQLQKVTKLKYTPLERQFMEIKEKYPECLLFVECGYKYRFFGEDAKIAARDLNIYCHLDHNFMTASIPTHRLFVHVRRLVAQGHKVGVVKQMETAAIKAAGDNKSAPFSRKLTAMYTKSTLIGEDVDPVFSALGPESANTGVAENTYLMCVFERPDQAKKIKTHEISVVAVQPATGDVIYDVFEDGATRAELETRVLHIQPVEVLLPESLSEATEKLFKQIISVSKRADDRIRVERLSDDVFDVKTAVPSVLEFFSETKGAVGTLMDIVKLSDSLPCCLSALLTYLREFNLHKVLRLAGGLRKFSTSDSHMMLNACTMRNLELFQNETDGRHHGSLLWVLDQTCTRFGGRLFRQWLAKPLIDAESITERLDAVTEIKSDPPAVICKLKEIVANLPDLEKGLCTIFHKKCSTSEFLSVCKSLENTDRQLRLQLATNPLHEQVKSALLCQLLLELKELLEGVGQWTAAIHQEAAGEGDKTKLFVDETAFPTLVQRKGEIENVLQELKDHRREVRLTLRIPALEYTTVLGTEFLIEVRNSLLKTVPADWVKICSTKAVTRFHSPFIVKTYKKLQQLREQLVIDAQEAWLHFLGSFEECYGSYRKAVHHLATLDCLFSLARVAKQGGFCRPQLLPNQNLIQIRQGRHPIVDMICSEQEQFVPNDTNLDANGERCMVITGPNMGGKSSYIKQVALITIMAHMGSYVPAETAQIGIVDGVFTRMGASDDLFQGRSTFMVELEEASNIIRHASSRSLVILDELGRGTSTHDGVAIAYATLKHFVQDVKCCTLFVTHYPMLAELQTRFPQAVANYHMAFMLHEEQTGKKDATSICDEGDVLTFLYQLEPGMAARSYGLNVARLASLPDTILKTAAQKSRELESIVTERRKLRVLFQQLMTASGITALSLLAKVPTASL